MVILIYMKRLFLITLLYILLFVPMVAADNQIYWTVTEDEDVEGTEGCSGGYPLIEDYPGIWELSVEEDGEDTPISKYIILPGEVFASVDCNHMVTLESSLFTVDKNFSAIDLRYRDTSGLWFLIQVDGLGFNNINLPWENKDCFDKSQNIMTVSNYPLPNLNDGNAHTLTIRIIDYDGYCQDASQIWIPTEIKESRKPFEKSMEESTGLGVSATRIMASILDLGNIKDLITGASDDEDEVTVVTSAVGEVYGPIPKGIIPDEMPIASTPPPITKPSTTTPAISKEEQNCNLDPNKLWLIASEECVDRCPDFMKWDGTKCIERCPSTDIDGYRAWDPVKKECIHEHNWVKIQNPDSLTSNGCGSGWNEKFVPDSSLLGNLYALGFDFTSACDNHDICYGTCNSGHAACDNKFLTEMRSECDSRFIRLNSRSFLSPLSNPLYVLGRIQCKATAQFYYGGVRAVGGSAFKAAQDEACIDNCTVPGHFESIGFEKDGFSPITTR